MDRDDSFEEGRAAAVGIHHDHIEGAEEEEEFNKRA